jgi:hypothetical protein
MMPKSQQQRPVHALIILQGLLRGAQSSEEQPCNGQRRRVTSGGAYRAQHVSRDLEDGQEVGVGVTHILLQLGLVVQHKPRQTVCFFRQNTTHAAAAAADMKKGKPSSLSAVLKCSGGRLHVRQPSAVPTFTSNIMVINSAL